MTATFAYTRKAKSERDCPRPDILTFHAAVDSRLSSALELPLRCASELPRARDLISACLCLVRTSAASFSSCLLHSDALLLKHVASCSVPTKRKEFTCSRRICAVFRVTLFLLGTVKTRVILLTIHGKVKSAHLWEFRETAESIAAFESTCFDDFEHAVQSRVQQPLHTPDQRIQSQSHPPHSLHNDIDLDAFNNQNVRVGFNESDGRNVLNERAATRNDAGSERAITCEHITPG